MGVEGSPCTLLLNSLEASLLLASLEAKEAALKLKAPPVVWVPPFNRGKATSSISRGIWKEIDCPAAIAFSRDSPGGLPAVTN